MATLDGEDRVGPTGPSVDQWFPPFTPPEDDRPKSEDPTSEETLEFGLPADVGSDDRDGVSVTPSAAVELGGGAPDNGARAGRDDTFRAFGPDPRRGLVTGPNIEEFLHVTRVDRHPIRSRAVVVSAVAAITVLALGVGGFVVAALGDAGADSAVNSAAASTTIESTAAAPPPWCSPSSDAGVVRGAGPGGTGSGADVILAFDHAYYVDRNGAKARTFLVPDAEVKSATAEELQAGIDTVPQGTEHCVEIRDSGPNTFAVSLFQRYPDGTQVIGRQVVSTVDLGGRTLITSIGKA
ncbi:hypothetical protein ABH922_004396 [Rhodococcus sp. 27YEA15]|uniref:hypothetical protein n=1 Tax=Rhodococcus sp. 27YEA15 TaxID=3156259 RepID=UPI003C798352